VTTPVPDADAAEQQLPADAASSPHARDVPPVGDDVPEADAVEQSQPVAPVEDGDTPDLPLEADGADAAEQAVVVPLDEDEGRE
jgi:hypothetical protein